MPRGTQAASVPPIFGLRPFAARLPIELPAILASVLLAAGGCGRPFAEGGSGELTVVTSWPADAPEALLLRAIVEREAVRIESEPAYSVRFVAPGDARVYRARNVLVIGSGPRSAVPAPARRLHAMLPKSDEPFAFTTDVWLRGQSAGMIWTDARADWIPAVARAQNRLFHALDRATFATVRSRILSLPRDDRAERRLQEAVGIRLRVPRGYRLSVAPGGRDAYLVDAGPPARMLRIATAPPDTATDLRRARAALARTFRPNERTLELAEPALTPGGLTGAVRQVYGRWEDGAATAAGPFRAYDVRRNGRAYLVDLAVFAPGRPKLPYLRELMAIAETLEPDRDAP